MNGVIIIPARYKSSRFPGKPLVDILGETLIERVWKQCIKAFDSDKVYVATDDEKVRKHCEEVGMQYIMTSEKCLTGTDRVAEAYKNLNKEYDTIINVQGDEPLIEPEDILAVAEEHQKFPNIICCGTCKIESEKEFRNPNIIKIIMNDNNYLLYASRGAIPTDKELGFRCAYKQVCIYAFSQDSLSSFNSGSKTTLESIEDVEFLRFLETGYSIKMVPVSGSSIPVDIPSDVVKVKNALREIQ